MRRLACVLVLFASPAVAESSVATASEISPPSAYALELAHMLKPTSLPGRQLSEENELKRAKQSLAQTTLAWKGAPCDLNDKRCDVVATEIAHKIVNNRTIVLSKMMETIFAQHFDQTMSAKQIKDAIDLLKTSQGKSLASAIMSVQGGMAFNQAMSYSPGSIFMTSLKSLDDTPFQVEFYDRTVGLPRTQRFLPVAPPPTPPITVPARTEGSK